LPVSAVLLVLICTVATVGAQTKQPEGLDSLSDDALLDELAARGMDSLLEHAFAVNKVPPERQSAIRTVIRLRELGDPNVKLSGAQRQKLIADIVKGIDLVLPGMRDPRLMMRQAADLLIAGVEREVNTLEYWGENPRSQARLRPIVQTVIKLLDRATQQARALSDEAANRMQNPDDKSAVQRYEQYDQLAREAVALAETTDLLCDHGDALIDLTEALRAAGCLEAATETARQALALYERKGNLVAAGRGRSLLHGLAPV
jgi:tetratricopeptide (TPR) repeat protein